MWNKIVKNVEKMLVKTKICRQNRLAVLLQYLYLSDKNTLTKMGNI